MTIRATVERGEKRGVCSGFLAALGMTGCLTIHGGEKRGGGKHYQWVRYWLPPRFSPTPIASDVVIPSAARNPEQMPRFYSAKTPQVFNMNNPVQAEGAARGKECSRSHRNSVGVQPFSALCCAPTEHRVGALCRFTPSCAFGLHGVITCWSATQTKGTP